MKSPVDPPRAPSDTSELKFTRQPMVGWFNPRQLLSTGIRALLSEVIGGYTDRREMQAALDYGQGRPFADYSDGEEIWIDFVADLGDGFDATYTVAHLLGQPTVTVDGDGATPRGRILIMGGDQVYPVARRSEYQNRLQGPYEAAFPYAPDGERPHLYAIPGNHDWYDGLTSFLRVFCQERSIGAWKTNQSRSYFALLLPHRWWVWGTDIQLEADIDRPQLDFFTQVCKKHVKPGDRIILCTAQPAWVDVAADRPDAYGNLAFFEREVIAAHDATLAVTLSGDLHHYARYESNDGRQKVTSGGGGAFLAGTHDLPTELTLPDGDTTQTFRRAEVYPSTDRSRALSRGAIGFLLHNRQFAMLLGCLYLFYAWLIQSASRRELGAAGESFMDVVSGKSLAEWPDVFGAVWTLLVRNPGVVAMLLLVVIGLAAFSAPERIGKPAWLVARLAGAVHGMLHIVLNVLLIWTFAWFNQQVLNLEIATALQSSVFTVETVVFGTVFGGILMGLYLFVSNRMLGLHRNDVFSAQSIPDYKNFLRLHVASDGALSIRAYGIDRAYRRWQLNPTAAVGEPWFTPQPGDRVGVRLIDRLTISPPTR